MQERRFSDPKDIDEFIDKLGQFERGELDPDQWRAYRLTRGVYGQRQDDVQMLRVKIPQGICAPHQLDVLAELADRSPRKIAHVTTRQNVQYHFIKLEEVESMMRLLDEKAGITMRGACGNSVRTVCSDHRAGLDYDDVFDPTPFGDAITNYLLRHPQAETLPRKFKIALSGSPKDRGYAAINDIGMIAQRDADGRRTFRVVVCGGLSSQPMNAFVVEEACPVEDIFAPVEALVNLFYDHGNRQNRGKARMKFVAKKLGEDGFRALYRDYLEKAKTRGVPKLAIADEVLHRETWELAPISDPVLARFARKNVERTRIRGRIFVTVRLPVGDLDGDQLRGVAQIARRYGEGAVRLTIEQNLVLRAVDESDLAAVHTELAALGLAAPDVGSSADVTSCPGVDTCRIAITNSSQLAKYLTPRLSARPVDDVTVKISGCPNSCGQHHIAALGFQGGVRKINDRAMPHYIVRIGGGIGPQGAKFGTVVGRVPARRVEETTDRILAYCDAHRAEGQTVGDFLRTTDPAAIKAIVDPLVEITDPTEEDFVDYGAEAAFEVVTMSGECAA